MYTNHSLFFKRKRKENFYKNHFQNKQIKKKKRSFSI
jgi:hypothetical protein